MPARCGCGGGARRARSSGAGWRCGCAGPRRRRRMPGPRPPCRSARWVIRRPAVRHQGPQQVELDRCQVDLGAVAAHGLRADVELEAVGPSTGSSASGPARRMAASQARDQLAAGRTAWSRNRRRRRRAPAPSPPPRRRPRGRGSASRSRTEAARRPRPRRRRAGRRSMIAASGVSTAAVSSASFAVAVASTSKPVSRRMTFSARMIWSSSSQTSTLRPSALTVAGPRADRRRRGRPPTHPSGSSITNVVPWPGSDSALRRPPLASTNPRAIASPRPEPECSPSSVPAVEGLEDPSSSTDEIPGPRSTIRSIRRSPTVPARTLTGCPPE